MRWILALLLFLISANAEALPLHGGAATSSNACVFTGSTTNGSCTPVTDSMDFLTNTAVSHATQYAAGGTGPLNFYLASTPSGSPWVQFSGTNEAVLCTGPGQIDTQITGISGFGNLWYEADDTGGTLPSWYQVPSSCGSIQSTFVNTTTSATYHGLSDMCISAASGNSLSVPSLPSGIPYWDGSFYGHQGSCDLTVSGVTVNIASGAKIFQATCEGTAGGFCLHAASLTISGPGALLGYDNLAGAIIDILPTETGTTIEGASGNPLTIDCQGLFGQAFQGVGIHGILSGSNTGTTTISNVSIKNCAGDADGGGDFHSVYFSYGGSSSLDATFCEAISHLTIQDAGGDTTALKLDNSCGGSGGTVTDASVYSTIEGHPSNNSDENEPIDFQCGGVHTVTHSLFEMYGQTSTSDQWAFNKSAWGATTNGCASTLPTVNVIKFDKDIFILDGVSPFAEGFSGRTVVSCGSAFDGNDCNANASGHAQVCITNSQIVEDTSNFSAPNSLWAGPGVYTDTGCTTSSGTDSNTYYRGTTGSGSAGRLMACSSTNWTSGSGTNCAFPFVPTFLTELEDHDTLVAQAHAAGFCGEGTSAEPIQECLNGADQRLAALPF